MAVCLSVLSLETANAIRNICSYLSHHCKALFNLINIIICYIEPVIGKFIHSTSHICRHFNSNS